MVFSKTVSGLGHCLVASFLPTRNTEIDMLLATLFQNIHLSSIGIQRTLYGEETEIKTGKTIRGY